MTNVFEKYTDHETFSKIVTHKNLTEMWASSARAYPENVAVVDEGVSYTYAQMDASVSLFRTALRRAGCAPGSLIGILCPNSVGFARAFLAAGTSAMPSVLSGKKSILTVANISLISSPSDMLFM